MKTKLLITLVVVSALITAAFTTAKPNRAVKKGMVKVTIMYPNGEGNTFDMDYYTNKHMPMVAELLGDAMTGYSIEKGIAGRTPEEPVPYLAIGYLHFEKLSDYREAFGPAASKILSDIPNYTNTQPVLQISEVVK